MKIVQPLRDLPASLRPQAAPGTWEVALSCLPDADTLFEQSHERPAILNCGAGRGGLSHLLGAGGYNVTSVDLHPEHFQVPDMHCSAADLNQPLHFADGEFDGVLAVEVIEHLENPWGFVRESIRVLKLGGLLVVTSPNVENVFSRLEFLFSGVLPYFRQESFEGCYHVTPIFPWTVERCCSTCSARLEAIRYSRVDWPTRHDVPRHDSGGRRWFLDLLPLDRYFGEIAAYVVRKTATGPRVIVGAHRG